MASAEALAALRSGPAEWAAFRAQASGVLDLSAAILTGDDLSGRLITECDLTASVLKDCNLDGTTFSGCVLNGTSFSNASLVRSTIERCEGAGVDLTRVIWRDAHLGESRFTSLDISGAVIEDCRFDRCRFEGVVAGSCRLEGATEILQCVFRGFSGSQTSIRGCRIVGSVLEGWNVPDLELEDCTFEASRLLDWEADHASLVQSVFEGCRLFRLRGAEIDSRNLDLSGSTLIDLDLLVVDLSSATLMRTAFVRCRWPRQAGRVLLFGSYVRSPHLMRQPVQDVQGVAPMLRRTIADAQYLDSRIAGASGRVGRVLFRSWGLVTAYGQSLSRLATATVIALVALTVALAARSSSDAQSFASEVPEASQVTVRSFIGVTVREWADLGADGQVIMATARALGFVVLGLWVSIAAVKLSRLSNE